MEATATSFPGSPSNRRRGGYVAVSPAYSRVSETLRRLSTGSLQCSLFCGGARCKYERGERWQKEDKALRGLFSHWITPGILAMARPSTKLFREEHLVEQFKELGIGTVVNLQLPWEHSRCGPQMESSGFTYRPEDAMRHGVYFYNYGWMDYGVPTLESVLDMVKVLDFSLGEGKVAVHCHAGLGRTGVLIACYLVYSRRLTGDQAISFVREKRPGSIQTRTQIEIVQQFDLFLRPLWTFFPSPSSPLTFDNHLSNQSLLLHGLELQRLKYMPKAIWEVCRRLLKLSYGPSLQGGQPITAEYPEGVHRPERAWGRELARTFLQVGTSSSEAVHTRVLAIQSDMNSSFKWQLVQEETDPAVLFSLLLLFFQGLKEPFLTPRTDLVALVANPSMDVLPRGKSLTLQCVLDALKDVFPRDTLSVQGHSLASKLTEALLQALPTNPFVQAPPTSTDSHHMATTIALITAYWSV